MQEPSQISETKIKYNRFCFGISRWIFSQLFWKETIEKIFTTNQKTRKGVLKYAAGVERVSNK